MTDISVPDRLKLRAATPVLVEAIHLYESAGFAKSATIPTSRNCDLAMSKKLG